MVPTTGAAALGTALVVTLALAAEIHPVAVSVTVQLKVVDAGRLLNVVVVHYSPNAPGLIVQATTVNQLKSKFPVVTAQVG